MTVRVRQIGPPRDSIEIARTLDVSRNGVLFRTRQPYQLHSTVWLILPFNPKAPIQEPEFPGTIVRIDQMDDGTAEIGIRFLNARADRLLGGFETRAAPQEASERRTKDRARLSLTVRVRDAAGVEITNTVDVSRTGVLFRSNKDYQIGQQIWVTVPYTPETPPDEVEARVVRILERAKMRCVGAQYTRVTGMKIVAQSY
jgi:Tfp pilus assembly protein PilZ